MEPEHHIPFGPFCLSVAPGRLWRGDQVIGLRPRSLAVLRYLVEHPGRLVTKAELRRQVWAGTHVTDSVLRASIKEIRAALGDAATASRYVETVGQEGYCFRGGDALEAAPPLTPGPIVGRQRDVAALAEWWQRAAHGTRQLVFINGEAGVGKTTVVELFLTPLAVGGRGADRAGPVRRALRRRRTVPAFPGSLGAVGPRPRPGHGPRGAAAVCAAVAGAAPRPGE